MPKERKNLMENPIDQSFRLFDLSDIEIVDISLDQVSLGD